MHSEQLLFSRYKLITFLQCQRRFQLRYVTRLPWPATPIAATLTDAFENGELFHRLLEQHFLGLPIELPDDVNPEIARWWAAFQEQPPPLPTGERYPEVSLSVPVGRHFLYGRFDLLILGEQQAHIVDWKTERQPRSAAQLRDDWQTRLYLAIVAAGSQALGAGYDPSQIAITYWFARAPQRSVTLTYDSAQHRRSWAEIEATVERIERRLVAPTAIWPLTDNWEQCKLCGYRTYCDRRVALEVGDESLLRLQQEDTPSEIDLEPTLL